MAPDAGRHLAAVPAARAPAPFSVPEGVDAMDLAVCLDAAQRRPTTRSVHQLERLATVGQVELARNLTHGPGQTLQAVVETVHRLLPNCGGVSAVLFDADSEEFFTSASTVPGQPQGEAAARVRRSRGATRFIVESGFALYVRDTHEDPFTANAMLDERGYRSYVGMPIRTDNGTTGVLYALGSSVDQFTVDDLELLAVVADRSAVVVQAAGEYQRVSRLASQQALLTHVSTAMAASEHPGLLLAEVLEATVDTLGLDALAVLPRNSRPELDVCVRGRWPVGWATPEHEDPVRGPLAEAVQEGWAAVVAMGDGRGDAAQLVAVVNDRTTIGADDRATLTSLAAMVTTAVRRAEVHRDMSASNEFLAQFAHVVSHDLRSPLSSIAGLVELVLITEGDELSEDGRECAERAIAATHRMADTIQTLLDSAKVRVGDLSRREVPLGRIVDEVLVDLADPIRVRDASVRVDALPSAWVDETGLRVVLQNLVSNALKFTRPGERPVIRISAVPSDVGVQVLVADEGIGIPEDRRDAVFSLFDRGGHERVDGHGIGLATVARIVDAHGGRIWFEANRPTGTVAVVELPSRPVWLEDGAR